MLLLSPDSFRLTHSLPLLRLRFANVKLTPLDTEQDGQRLLRKLTEQKLVQPTKRCVRPYLFAQSISYENTQVEEKHHWMFDRILIQASTSTMKVSGYLRGIGLSVNDLVYIPDLGTFQLDKAEENQFERQVRKQTLERTPLSTVCSERWIDEDHRQMHVSSTS